MRLIVMLLSASPIFVVACHNEGDVDGPYYAQGEPQVRAVSPAQLGKMTGDELIQLLMIEDEALVVDGLNDAKRRGVAVEALGLLEAVWQQQLPAYPDLAWSTLLRPLVRLNVVDVLVQAAKNGETEAEPEEAHAFVRMVVRESEPRVASQGLITLALFEREDDVPLIEELAHAGNEQVFRSAVIALSTMCAGDASEALSRLEGTSSGANRTFTAETAARMANYKQRTGQCQ